MASTTEIVADLTSSAARLDRAQTQALSQQLVQALAAGNAADIGKAQAALDLLRSRRFFAEMLTVADALRGLGQDSPKIRRLYAQGLIEEGKLSAALDLLQALVRDTAQDRKDAGENAEARGLIGRVYKQRFVGWTAAGNSIAREALKKAVEAYHEVYDSDPTSYTWHGINVVALLARAARDGLPLTGYRDHLTIAREIRRTIEATSEEKRAGWDLGTAMEACLALSEWSAALDWAKVYVEHGSIGAFGIASTRRQLLEIWQLESTGDPGGELVALLNAAQIERGPSPEEAGKGQQLPAGHLDLKVGAVGAFAAAGAKLERRFGADGFVGSGWFTLGLKRARGVGRVETLTGASFGSGFLVRGSDLKENWGKDLLLITNAHVVSDTYSSALRDCQAQVRFHGLEGAAAEPRTVELLWTSPPMPTGLDVSVLRVNPVVTGVEPCPLRFDSPEALASKRLYIIGHPGGGDLSFSINDNLLIGWKDPRLHYRTPTEPGSSGSPVFDTDWNVVAVHHSGNAGVQRLDGPGTYDANEGIWVEAVKRAAREA